jgi:hypothetical protein
MKSYLDGRVGHPSSGETILNLSFLIGVPTLSGLVFERGVFLFRFCLGLSFSLYSLLSSLLPDPRL